MKYYIIVGEASGDLHASRLMQSLKKFDEAAEFRFFGGDLMQNVGGTRVRHYKELGIYPCTFAFAYYYEEYEALQRRYC